MMILKVNVHYKLKFGLSEKHTKFEKNLPHGLDVYLVGGGLNKQEMDGKFLRINKCVLLHSP